MITRSVLRVSRESSISSISSFVLPPHTSATNATFAPCATGAHEREPRAKSKHRLPDLRRNELGEASRLDSQRAVDTWLPPLCHAALGGWGV
jgi:hypothetical protein